MEHFREIVTGVMRAIDDLPTLPDVLFDVERVMQDETSGATEVALIIEEDMSLTAKVLRVVNSAYYGGNSTISSVQEAVARMGFREIQNLVTTAAILSSLSGMGKRSGHKQFWRHSVTAAYAARVITEISAAKNPFTEEEGFVAGILHDVGVLFLDQYFEKEFNEVHAHAQEKACSRAEAELEVLGLDHGEIGGELMDFWSLPEGLVEAVRWHHQPERCTDEFRIQTETIRLADRVVYVMESEDAGRRKELAGDAGPEEELADGAGLEEELADDAWASLGIATEDFPRIIEGVVKETKHSPALLGLI